MRHKLLVLTVKKFLQSVYIYGSYRKIKTGVPFFLDHPVYIFLLSLRTFDDIKTYVKSNTCCYAWLLISSCSYYKPIEEH